MGVALFIVSEVFAFVSVFWAFFHSSLAPTIELGSQWPPVGIEAVSAFELPLLNTILLLSSGATVTYSHHALIQGNRRAAINGLILTIVLALAFTACQGIEYYNTSFSMSDSVYGTVFFASTGLHGMHVLVGSLFLLVGLFRLINYHLTDSHHLGYESAILYWHKK
jgi:cytochrome c oxidase subunit 3